MNTSSTELIEQAITEAKSGNKAEAKKILAKVVRLEPGNARAWDLLSRVLEDKEQIIYCLILQRKVAERQAR
jgi:Flp pilus assembly protein TadD